MEEQQRALIPKQTELAITSSVLASAGDEEEKEKKLIKNEKEARADGILCIGVHMSMHGISDINTTSQTFNCRFLFRLTWIASDEDIDAWENNGGKDDPEWKPSFVPQMIFPNALQNQKYHIKMDHKDIIK